MLRLPRRVSTQTYLLSLVAAVVVPLLVFAGFLLLRYAAIERARFDENAREIAKQISLVIDQELAGMASLMQAMANASALRAGDIATFREEAARIGRATGRIIMLRDREGRQVAHSLMPEGRGQVQREDLSPYAEEAARTKRATFSDVFVRSQSREPMISVYTPVVLGDEVPYILALSVPVRQLRDAVLPAVPAGWIVAVGDRAGAYVLRSQRHEDVAGKPGLPEYVEKVVGREGSFTSTNFEGVELLAGYHRSARSGWFTTANIVTDAVEAPLRRSLYSLAALGALALALSAAFAYLFGRGLTAAATALAARAANLGEGRRVLPLRSNLRELDVVGDALVKAADGVQARAREREQAADRQRLLMQELNHRVKNTLANVLSIASLTARSATDIGSYKQGLIDRVQALAKTHDALSSNEWNGADLQEILHNELAPYRDERDGRVVLQGPDLLLSPRASVALGMMMHELTTNAAKYGALSVPGGRLGVRWSLKAEGETSRLILTWREAGGPPVEPPSRQGFGTRMIEKALARELDAKVEADYAPAGLNFTLSMPLKTVQAGDGTGTRRAEYAKLVNEPETLRIY